jgi:hypothetical protein
MLNSLMAERYDADMTEVPGRQYLTAQIRLYLDYNQNPFVMSTMRYLLCAFVFLASTDMFSQVEVDQNIVLTGGPGVSSISGLVDAPVQDSDAVNKAYVDAAVSATGGGVQWARFAEFISTSPSLTFTVPTGVTLIKVQVFGGGGGGGGGGLIASATAFGGGGGGAGGFCEGIFEVTEGDLYTAVIGAGGAGGAGLSSNPGTAGSAGGSSSFTGTGISISATGGLGGGHGGSTGISGMGGQGGYGFGAPARATLGNGGSGAFLA